MTEAPNFFYRLEAGSRQIKVTSIDLKLQGQRAQEGEIPKDAWSFSAEVTNRVKDETPPRTGPNAARP